MSQEISKETVAHMAALARLSVTEEEKTLFARQFGDILAYMEVLSKVDTDGIEPLYNPVPHASAMREDRAEHRRSREEVLQNAPERDEGLFLVPRIV